MAFQIEERFQIPAPPNRVWSFLTDPQQVVRCLPGAELLEVQDERTFLGRVRVKIGPVTASYRGKAEFAEVDAENRRLRMVGEGQETGGSGSARMTMSSEVAGLPDGGSEVRVAVEMEVVGKVVQFGRGMIEEVSRQLFRQFASSVEAALTDEAGATAAGGVAAGVPTGGGTPPDVPATATPASPLNGLRLLWRALLAWLRRLFRRPRKA